MNYSEVEICDYQISQNTSLASELDHCMHWPTHHKIQTYYAGSGLLCPS